MSAIKRTRILYVEDHDDTREMVALMLADSPCDVTAVETYAEALAAAKQEGFDLYILDNWLPDGLGIALCREIRSFDPTSPIIFCSGFDDDGHRQMATLAGASTLVTKPFDVSELITAIESLMRKAD
jgi:DNA-binding response OmpR family regulator